MVVKFQVGVLKGGRTRWPRGETPDCIFTVGKECREELVALAGRLSSRLFVRFSFLARESVKPRSEPLSPIF
ncbi:hypothetical protein PV433_00050 [Paenibacillus sp. GYB004]|uniref:hypothetical protein n=1 Tax=Paenibacillus sp. GYB004 TaxID=2994393 RepID=UPI002F9650E5